MPRSRSLAAAAAVLVLMARSASAQAAPEHAHGAGGAFWRRFAAGFVTSIAAHESAHIVATYAVGSHVSFGFDKGRPTVYSNIDVEAHPRDQFIFSSAGLVTQSVMDEAILDVPHRRGAAFERGLLAGGLATTVFYITLGRRASVSDVTFMARTSKLSIDQVSLIYGTVAAMHLLRIRHDHAYAHFFTAPDSDGRLRVGMRIAGE